MNPFYEDILSRISEPPKWFDENAVPRYVEFHPYQIANIYADRALLMEIACQACDRRFHVAMSMHERDRGSPEWVSPEYGDPPNVHCCPAGPSMQSVPIAILQSWILGKEMNWERVVSEEGPVECDWANGD